MKTEGEAAIKVPPRKPEPTPAPPARTALITNEAPRSDSLRDTFESIVVALILAFVFRAFIVEAFVIPTGSMAPSLYGKHGLHRCAACHYPFAYGIREESPTATTSNGPRESFSLKCPNCGWSGTGNASLNRPGESVMPNSGDRILVLKWPYDIGGSWLGPQRWDVVVFKDPEDGETNFIKRLLGLPGEVLELINGDLYAAPAKQVPADILDALSQPPPSSSRERRLSREQSDALAKVLKIQRKTPTAQESLWMLHYDHDFNAPLKDGQSGAQGEFNPPRFEATNDAGKKAWDTQSPVVRFTPTDDKESWIRLTGKPIVDDYGYNNVSIYQREKRDIAVGDVRLKFVLFPKPGEGHLALRLTKDEDQFLLTIGTNGDVLLKRTGKGGVWIELRQTTIPALRPGKPLEIEYENLDYRITLRIDGEEIAATDDKQYAPDVKKLLTDYQDGRRGIAGIQIGAQGVGFEFRHLQVHRDVYYRSDSGLPPPMHSNDYSLQGLPAWGTANNPIYLRDKPIDFFCCGDNSPQSKDARLWVDVCPMLQRRGNYQYGTVPGDLMIGKAFFVYWPSGLRFSKESLAVIPNVGRMRIIR